MMASITSKPAAQSGTAVEPEPIDTTYWPPMSDEVRTAQLRMLREPHLLDGYGEDDWVAFSGDEIVASGPDLDKVLRECDEAGKPATLIVPIMGGIWI